MGSQDLKIPVRTPDGKTDGTVELLAELFDVTVLVQRTAADGRLDAPHLAAGIRFGKP